MICSDRWFASEVHHLLVGASERGVPLPVMVDVLLTVVATAVSNQPSYERAEILMRLAIRLGLDMEISVEPRAPNRPC